MSQYIRIVNDDVITMYFYDLFLNFASLGLSHKLLTVHGINIILNPI